MGLDFDKLAERFEIGARQMTEDERRLFASATETVLLEKQAGTIPDDLTEDDVILLSALVADELLRES